MPQGTDIGSVKTVAWPFGALNRVGRCAVLDGNRASELSDLARKVKQPAAWNSGGQLWHLVFHPLVPDEDGCPAGE